MLVREARTIAQRWVEVEASNMPGFAGAFIFGSVNWKPDEKPLPATSDLDVRVVLDAAEIPPGYHKFVYEGVLLEISYGLLGDFELPEAVLSDYATAGHFTRPCILADPRGQLGRIQAVVAREFPRRKWVQARVEAATSWQLNSLNVFLNKSDPLHEQVFAWVYATTMFCHMVLVADLKNPTVRKMMAASQEVLAHYDQLAFHESVLSLLGSAALSQQQVEQLLATLVEVFDTAKALRKTEFFGSTAISDEGRPTTIGGIEEIIGLGYPREAAFWLIVVHTWCQKVLFNDASAAIQARYTPAYEQLLNSLGIASLEDIYQRIEQIKALRPQAATVTEYIMAQNPEIID